MMKMIIMMIMIMIIKLMMMFSPAPDPRPAPRCPVEPSALVAAPPVISLNDYACTCADNSLAILQIYSFINDKKQRNFDTFIMTTKY